MDDVSRLHREAVAEFGRRVHEIPDDRWDAPTPCTGWDVRTLVNHLVYEDLWTPEMFAGRTIAEVGDRYEGDQLGEDPVGTWERASRAAVAAVGEPGALDRTVHLSFGETPGTEYAMQLFADHLIHAWDLARAVGGDERLDPELVAACSAWFTDDKEGAYRGGGSIAERVGVPASAEPQTVLLARFGRQA